MHTNIDHVRARQTLKQPMSDAQSAAVRDDATRFATRLLENYKDQLSSRQLSAPSQQENLSSRS